MKKISLLLLAIVFAGCASYQPPTPHIIPAEEPTQEQTAAEVLTPPVSAESNFEITTPSGIVYTNMQGFFVKNTAYLPNDENFFIAVNDNMFLTMFGVAKTLDNVVTVPDFNKNIVLAVVLKPAKYDYDIIVNDIIISGEELTFKYGVVVKNSIMYTSTFFKAVEIERPPTGVKNIVFDNGKQVVKVPFTVAKPK
jgi:hypothetical protein